MGVESVSVAEALSPLSCWHSWNLLSFPYYRVLLPSLESMESKRHTSYRSYSTNVYIQNHRRTALKLLGKTARTTGKVLKLKNSNLSSANFWSSFLISQKCPTMSPHQEATADSSEGSRNLPKWWSPRLGHGAVLAESKPLQVSK